MNEDIKAAVVVGIDVMIWALALWLAFGPKDSAGRAQMYWYLARGCQECATWFGSMAIEAELRYYAEVKL